MTIPLSTMVTSVTTGTSSNQVMTNTTGFNFINVVGSVCGAQTLMSGSNPVLGCSTGAIAPAGINLSSILPSGNVVPSALPASVQPTAQSAGGPFGLKNGPSLHPLNLLQLPGGSLIFNPLQQQQFSQFASQQPASSNPQQQGDQSSEQGCTNQNEVLSAQQTAVVNLGGVGSFMQPQPTASQGHLATWEPRGGH